MILALFLSSLFGFILLGIPIAFALFLTALVLSWFMGSWSPPLVVQTIFRGIDSFPLMAIPFFLLAGNVMNASGMTDRLFVFSNCLVGHLRGGLGHVTVVASMIVAGMSGSALAEAGGLGIVAIKAMRDRGYDGPFSAALMASAATIGPIIPPSIPMIVFGAMVGVSTGKLFLGGIIPGIMMGLSLMAINIPPGCGRHPQATRRRLGTRGLLPPASGVPAAPS